MKGKLFHTLALLLILCIVVSSGATVLAAGETNMVNVIDCGAVGDGVTDDSAAVKKAFDETQNTGGTIYFPAGRYNLNGLKLRASKAISLAGEEGGGSVLLQPGVIDCYSSVALNDLEIIDDVGVYLNLFPTGAVSLQVDSVKYGSAIDYNNKSRFIYGKTESNVNYYTSIEVTNCDISNVRYGIQIQCRIDSGLVSNNRISQLGNPNELLGAAAIKLGYPNSGKVFARNVIISNNRITDIKTAYASSAETCEAHGILLYGGGGCVIEGNYLENIIGGLDHEGIYTKSPDVKILNNTLVNAGDGNGSIVSKKNSDKNDIIISGNTIINTLESGKATCGIYIASNRFTISGNTIEMKRGIAVYKSESCLTEDAVITGNIVNISGRTGFYILNITGTMLIADNKIGHLCPIFSSDATIKLNIAQPAAKVEITGNDISVSNTKMFWINSAVIGTNVDVHDNTFSVIGKPLVDRGMSYALLQDNITA